MSYQNPWRERDARLSRKYFDGDVDCRYNDPDVPEPKQCPKCGETAYFKASVGALVCPNSHVLRDQ